MERRGAVGARDRMAVRSADRSNYSRAGENIVSAAARFSCCGILCRAFVASARAQAKHPTGRQE
jgi:hypothetical protein